MSIHLKMKRLLKNPGNWFIIGLLLFVVQCNFNIPTKIVVPKWQMTMTVPLVNENYKFDGISTSDSLMSIYGDSIDVDGDGIFDIFMPDSNAPYPGGLYIGMQNAIDRITIPADMFVIPGQSPIQSNVGPILLASMMPDSIVFNVDTILTLADLGVTVADWETPVYPVATCADKQATTTDTISFTFGNQPNNLNFADTVKIPGYQKSFQGSFPQLTGSPGPNEVPCGDGFSIYDTTVTLAYSNFMDVPQTVLPSVRQSFAILPSSDVIPAGAPFSSLESITIQTGSIQTVFNNQLPTGMENVTFRLFTKKSTGQEFVIHDHSLNIVQPYMQNQLADTILTTDLSGVILYDSLIFEFTGLIPPTSNDTLMFPTGVDPNLHYQFMINITEFQSIQVQMNDMTINETQPINTASSDQGGQSFSVQIVSAEIKTGIASLDTNRLGLSFANNLGTDFTLKMHLLNFYASTLADTNLVVSLPLTNGQQIDTTLDLIGYVLRNAISSTEPMDSLYIVTEAIFGNNGIASINLTQDSLALDVAVDIKAFQIQTLNGFFDVGFSLSEDEQTLSLPGLLGGLQFGDVIMSVSLFNEFGIAPGLGLIVNGRNATDSVVIALNPDSVTFDAGALGSPTATTIKLQKNTVSKIIGDSSVVVQHFPDGKSLTDLVGLLPDRVSIGGATQIRPDSISSISPGASIWGNWRLEIPFYFGIAQGGVEFLPSNYTTVAPTDSGTITTLVGDDGVPDNSDMLIASRLYTTIDNGIGLGFDIELLVSDIKYFPFFNAIENKVFVSADLNDDGSSDTLDLNLDSLILHPITNIFTVSVVGGEVDPLSGIVIPGGEGHSEFVNSVDFNLDALEPDSSIGSLLRHRYAQLDTFIVAIAGSGTFASVDDALLINNIIAPTVPDSLYQLELSEDAKSLRLIYETSEYGELGWLIIDKPHYIATKFTLLETANPALITTSTGMNVLSYLEFILNSEPLISP